MGKACALAGNDVEYTNCARDEESAGSIRCSEPSVLDTLDAPAPPLPLKPGTRRYSSLVAIASAQDVDLVVSQRLYPLTRGEKLMELYRRISRRGLTRGAQILAVAAANEGCRGDADADAEATPELEPPREDPVVAPAPVEDPAEPPPANDGEETSACTEGDASVATMEEPPLSWDTD